MSAVAVLGAKGGVGASLVATNLALVLQSAGGAILVDLNVPSSADDMLLDITPGGSWADLLPVADELTRKHVDLASGISREGLQLLSPPHIPHAGANWERIPNLIRSLKTHAEWVILDADIGLGNPLAVVLAEADCHMIVATPDPPALRGARQVHQALPGEARRRAGLVVNQMSRRHPVDAESIARALEIPLMGCLPFEPARVAEQVNFGRPVVRDGDCAFSREVSLLAERLVRRGIQTEI